MLDSQLLFTSNGEVSAGTYSSILDIGKWAAKGVWVEIVHTGVVGGSPQTGAQLTATIEYSDSATFATVDDVGPRLVGAQNTALFRVSKLCQSKRRYARLQYSVTGTSPCFTGIYAHITSGPQRDDVAGVNSA